MATALPGLDAGGWQVFALQERKKERTGRDALPPKPGGVKAPWHTSEYCRPRPYQNEAKVQGLVTHALRMVKRGEHHFIMEGYAL